MSKAYNPYALHSRIRGQSRGAAASATYLSEPAIRTLWNDIFDSLIPYIQSQLPRNSPTTPPYSSLRFGKK